MKTGVYVNRVDNWLGEAERLDYQLRPVIGATATVFVLQLAQCSWRVAYCTQAPGHFARAVEGPDGAAWPNRFNAILAGLIGVRAHWRKVGVPQLVAAVNSVLDRLEE